MIKDLKSKDLDKIFKKLGVEKKQCSHHVRGFLEENGKAVLPLHYSHGRKGLHGPNLHKFRKSLHIDNEQFQNLVKCTFSRLDLISVLRDKGVF